MFEKEKERRREAGIKPKGTHAGVCAAEFLPGPPAF
jgi:hypothetical protein